MPNSKINKGRITLVISYIALIYLTLPVMRPVLNFLKDILGSRFSLLTDIMLIAVMAGLAYKKCHQIL